MREAFRSFVEQACVSLAWHLPRQLVYWCFIRVASHGTTGPYDNTSPCDLTVAVAAQRWDKTHAQVERERAENLHAYNETSRWADDGGFHA